MKRAALIGPPRLRAICSARFSVRLTMVTGAKPRERSAKTIAFAAPPAPSTTAGPGWASQPGASWSRLARKPGASVLAPISRPSSSQMVLSAPMARAASSISVDRGEGRLLVRHRDVAADEAGIGEVGEEGRRWRPARPASAHSRRRAPAPSARSDGSPASANASPAIRRRRREEWSCHSFSGAGDVPVAISSRSDRILAKARIVGQLMATRAPPNDPGQPEDDGET